MIILTLLGESKPFNGPGCPYFLLVISVHRDCEEIYALRISVWIIPTSRLLPGKHAFHWVMRLK